MKRKVNYLFAAVTLMAFMLLPQKAYADIAVAPEGAGKGMMIFIGIIVVLICLGAIIVLVRYIREKNDNNKSM